MAVERKLRTVIADITARLNRSNLTAEDGVQQAELLKKAYEHLDRIQKCARRSL